MSIAMPASVEEARRDPYAALRYSDYRFFLTGRLAASMGSQMIDVAIGWELYERTHRALALGFVGLVQVVPTSYSRCQRATLRIGSIAGESGCCRCSCSSRAHSRSR